MKQIIKTSVVVLVFMGLFSIQSKAQSKLGHINAAILVQLMDETKSADKSLQDLQSSLQAQLKVLSTEYQTKVGDYEKNQATYSDATKQSKAKDITDLQDRMQKFQTDAQTQLSDKRDQLMQPIFEKARTAIQSVSKEKGYTYVFDTSKGDLLVFPEGDDILPSVKKKLGITAATPVAGASAPSGK
jgi:outer membrane protein